MEKLKKFFTGAVLGVSLALVSTVDLDAQTQCQICTEESVAGGWKYARLYNNTQVYYNCRVYNQYYDWRITLYPYTMSTWLIMGPPNIQWWYECLPE